MDQLLNEWEWVFYAIAGLGVWITILLGAIACHRRQRRRPTLILVVGASITLLATIISATYQVYSRVWAPFEYMDFDNTGMVMDFWRWVQGLWYLGGLVFAFAFLAVANSFRSPDRPVDPR